MTNTALDRSQLFRPFGTRSMSRRIRALLSEQPAIARFLERCHRRTYAAKSVIISAGEVSDELYLLLSGSVAVLIGDEPSGQEIVLAYLNEGDFFGELGLFEEKHRRTAWVCTRTTCDVAQISYERLRKLSLEYPEIMHAIYAQLARRLQETNRKLGDLAFTDVTGRIVHALLALSRQPDAMTHPEGTQLRITRQELGRIVGCSREMVGRVLKTLDQQGLVNVKGKTIVVYGRRYR